MTLIMSTPLSILLSIAAQKVEVGSKCVPKGQGAGFRIVFIALVMRINLMVTTLGSSSTHHLLQCCDSAVGLSLSTMFFKAFGQTGFRTLERLPSGIAGVQLSVWDPLVLLPLLNLDKLDLPDLHGFFKWVLDACCLRTWFVNPQTPLMGRGS